MKGVLTIRTALARSCRWFPDRPALIQGDRTITYGEFESAMKRISGGYRELGLRKGERVTFLCAATIDHALAFYSAHQVGAITVNLHLRETTPNQVKLFERLQPALLVCDGDKLDAARQIATAYPNVRIVTLGEVAPSGGHTLKALLSGPEVEPVEDINESDPAIIQLTSGSTGMPKALVHSHGSVLESWTGGLYMWSGISPQDRFLNAFSPSFVVWLVHPGSFLIHGGAVIFQPKWDPEDFVRSVQDLSITCAALTPTQWRAVMTSAPNYDLSSLRMAAYLGEKIAPERLKELTESVCPMFCSFYGMSECLGIGGCVIRSPEFIERGKWGSVGKPSINSDLRISEPGSAVLKEQARNQIGEVVVRAASFAMMNWGDPAWQSRVLTNDGWYRTGDLGYIDSDGYVFLGGRVDNQIATGGIKVAPEEIEQVLGANPELASVAVIGVEDEQWGQRIVGCVVARKPGLSAAELETWCKSDGRLAGYKCPKEWYFFEALPQTSVGKLDRTSLHELVAARRPIGRSSA